MEKLISQYLILLPYLLAIVQIFQWRGMRYGCYMLILLCLWLFVVHVRTLKLDRYAMIKWSMAYMVLVWIFQILAPPAKEVYNPYNPMFYTIFLIVGLGFWSLGASGREIFTDFNKKVLVVLVAACLLCGLYKMSMLGDISLYLGSGFEENLVLFLYQVVPYLLLWVAAVFFVFDKRIQVAIIALFVIIILVSAKRGPLVSMALGLAAVAVLQRKVSVKQVVIIVVLLGVGFFVLSYLFKDYVEIWTQRWQSDDDGDVSSGRTEIWSLFFNAISNQGIFATLFGNGYEASHRLTSRSWGISIGAHNDFIDILYNFGILGFALFVGMVISWTRYVFLALKNNYKHVSMMIYLLVCFVMGSLVSSNMTRLATIFFGALFYYCAGQCVHHQALKKENITPTS